MVREVKRVSRIGRVKLNLHKHRTMKSLYYEEFVGRTYAKTKQIEKQDSNNQSIKPNQTSTEETGHIIDKLL